MPMLVITCDPLPGGVGKGVVIANTREEAIKAIDMFYAMEGPVKPEPDSGMVLKGLGYEEKAE